MLVTAVRHAESLGNAGMLTWDDPDPLLSPRGIEQAKRAAARLAREDVTHLWSSPFRRAIQTASFLAQAVGLDVRLEPGMVEHYIFEDLANYTGRTGRELKAEFPFVRVPEDFRDGGWTPAFPETWEQLLERTRRVAERALRLAVEADDPDAVHVVIFGHGASTKGFVSALGGEAIPQDAGFVNTGMSRVRLDGALPGMVEFLNDKSHLSPTRHSRYGDGAETMT